MTAKKYIVTVLLIFLVAMLWNGLYHMVIIAAQNSAIDAIRRPDFSDKLLLSLLITAAMAALFVANYAKWKRTGTLKESLMHGLYFAVLAGVLVNANQYLVYPIPGSLAFLWFVGALIEFSLYAMVTYFVYRI